MELSEDPDPPEELLPEPEELEDPPVEDPPEDELSIVVLDAFPLWEVLSAS